MQEETEQILISISNLNRGVGQYKIGYFARQDFIDNEQMMLSYGINKYASEIEVVKWVNEFFK